ncbi:hypothetical protein GOODEAATRI_006009 [Goodea atripinnis]|uniref:Uncharacterized protein n=1 Tax=Goodea atripinnis TaxID=208336 RepID=A0ABV0PVP0_9TELE
MGGDEKKVGEISKRVIPGLGLPEDFVHSRGFGVGEWSQILYICLHSQARDVTPHDLCQDLELSSMSAKQLQLKDGDLGALQSSTTILIYRASKQNGRLLGMLVRCYYSKLICVCYRVNLLLQ